MSEENILHVWHQASMEERLEGQLWYPTAQRRARSFGGDLERNAGIIAALSPSVRWEWNLKWAGEFIRTGKIDGYGGYTRNLLKAIRILHGEPVWLVLGMNSPKMRDFAALIRDGGENNCVCVDGHATNISDGNLGPIGTARSLKPNQYELVASEYRSAAHRLNVRPSVLQAVTWVTWRRIRNESQV